MSSGKVIGPSGRLITIGGPTWNKLSESQRKKLSKRSPSKASKKPKKKSNKSQKKVKDQMYLVFYGEEFDLEDDFAEIKLFEEPEGVVEYVFDLFQISSYPEKDWKKFSLSFGNFIESSDTKFYSSLVTIRKISATKGVKQKGAVQFNPAHLKYLERIFAKKGIKINLVYDKDADIDLFKVVSKKPLTVQLTTSDSTKKKNQKYYDIPEHEMKLFVGKLKSSMLWNGRRRSK